MKIRRTIEPIARGGFATHFSGGRSLVNSVDGSYDRDLLLRCGLDRANWTYEELATSLEQAPGITVKRTAMRDFCQRHGLRPYRPTSRDLRGDPEKQQAAREEGAA